MATFQFTSVRSSMAAICSSDPDGGKGTPVFTIDLFSPSGDIADAGFSIREDRQGLIIQFLGYGSGPEEYRLRISYRGSEVDRLLTVP